MEPLTLALDSARSRFHSTKGHSLYPESTHSPLRGVGVEASLASLFLMVKFRRNGK
jgi:hypothetical protein